MNVSCSDKRAVAGFTCTGSDESHVWNHLHNEVPKMFNCQGVCGEHYKKFVNGLHSTVSLGIGKPLVKEEYKRAFEEFVREVNLVYQTAKRDRRI